MKFLLLFIVLFTNTIVAQEKINDSICSEVSFKEDKFNGEKTYSSPDIDNISFIKYVNKNKINQYVSISIYDTYFSGYNNYGLSILFKSGKKIIRSKEKVDVDPSTGADWRYSVFFVPTINEIKLFKNEEIETIKLYIFDKEINRGTDLNLFARCILVTPKATINKKK